MREEQPVLNTSPRMLMNTEHGEPAQYVESVCAWSLFYPESVVAVLSVRKSRREGFSTQVRKYLKKRQFFGANIVASHHADAAEYALLV